MTGSAMVSNEFAQKEKYAKRRFNRDSDNYNSCVRNEFSRDRDRILFSRAFRRLVHKAQIYSFEQGDHFRTRLTHTIEVTQIARSISRNLSLNEDLTEAIALGHDVGHTPFGHQGEEVLNEILSGKIDIGEKIKYPLDFGGFKHNYYSIRILDIIEKKYEDLNGLNLTWQVLEGILKHTKIRVNGNILPIHRFMHDPSSSLLEMLHLDKSFSATLEGQIVFFADEIAQRQHDLDDGLRDKNLKFDVHKVIEKIIDFGKLCCEKHPEENDAIIRAQNLIDKLRNRSSKDILFLKNSLIRDVIEYFIIDITEHSKKQLKTITERDYIRNEKELIFKKNIISFSPVAMLLNKKIEEYIFNKIINSYAVNVFDGKAVYILKKLFKAYYKNPRQMPPYVLDRIISSIRKNSLMYDIKTRDGASISNLNFRDNPIEVKLVIDILRLDFDVSKILCPEGFSFSDKEEIKKRFQEIHDRDMNKIISEEDKFIRCLIENNYAFISSICDYIAGMTDNYAQDEYKKLYLV
jgi:dGTPase